MLDSFFCWRVESRVVNRPLVRPVLRQLNNNKSTVLRMRSVCFFFSIGLNTVIDLPERKHTFIEEKGCETSYNLKSKTPLRHMNWNLKPRCRGSVCTLVLKEQCLCKSGRWFEEAKDALLFLFHDVTCSLLKPQACPHLRARGADLKPRAFCFAWTLRFTLWPWWHRQDIKKSTNNFPMQQFTLALNAIFTTPLFGVTAMTSRTKRRRGLLNTPKKVKR